MSTGILWYDDDPAHTLLDRVLAASRRYARKFGAPANVVYVHPSALETALTRVVGGMPVIARRWMLLHHYYAVREDE